MTLLEVLVALVILLGMVGIIVPVLPGVLLVGVAVLVWSWEKSEPTGWWVLGVVLALLAVGQVVKYLIPGRRLRTTVPTRTLVVGAVGAVAGFFLIPVVGVLVGFPVGVYLAERVRLGSPAAGASTRRALHAVGLSILIELASAVLATGVWVSGVLMTAP